MATRKYEYHKCEVIDSTEPTWITPSIVFGYNRDTNNANYCESVGNHIISKSSEVNDGDRFLFKTDEPIKDLTEVFINDVPYTVDETPLLMPGYHVLVCSSSADKKLSFDEFDLDEQDYVYCSYIISGCIKVAENYMKYDVLPKTYRAFRNDLTGDYIDTTGLYDNVEGAIFELRLGVVPDSVKITYTDTEGNSKELAADEFYAYNDKVIVTANHRTEAKLGVVCIQYSVENHVGDDLRAALLQHISEAYESRGLCTSETCPAALGMGDGVKAVYNTYRRIRIGE